MENKIEQLEAEVERLTSALATEVPELKARLVPLESDLAAANATLSEIIRLYKWTMEMQGPTQASADTYGDRHEVLFKKLAEDAQEAADAK